MSESNEPKVPETADSAARAPSPTPSERSTRSDLSTASSRLPKPTGARPRINSNASSIAGNAAGDSVPTRIGRICTAHGHQHKASLPSLELNKSK